MGCRELALYCNLLYPKGLPLYGGGLKLNRIAMGGTELALPVGSLPVASTTVIPVVGSMCVIWKPFTQLVLTAAEQTFWTIRFMTPEMVGSDGVLAAAGLSATSAQIQ